MNCNIKDCTGHYKEREIVHAARRDGEVIVIDHVPAEVCSVCGDVLFTPETVRRIERLRVLEGTPERTAPVVGTAIARRKIV